MSTFVIVPGAWDTPATLEPVIEPLGTAGHDVIVVDLPCGSPDATWRSTRMPCAPCSPMT